MALSASACVAAARNDLVAFLDSDDEWMPDKLALQRTFLAARPDVLFPNARPRPRI